MILDAQNDTAAQGPRHPPHRNSTRHMTQVKDAGGGGREARSESGRRRLVDEKGRVQRFTAMPTSSNRAPNRRAPEPMKARAGNSFVK